MRVDIAICGGTVVTVGDTMRCDVEIRDGRVVMLSEGICDAARIIDATGKYVLPGGVGAHCDLGPATASAARSLPSLGRCGLHAL